MKSNIRSQLQDIRVIYRPSTVLLNNWKLWIANEVISNWQNTEREELKHEDILNSLKLSNDKLMSILDQIKSKIENAIETVTSIEQLKYADNKLEEYFSDISTRELQESNEILRNKNIKDFHKKISDSCTKANPSKTTAFLRDLSKILYERKNSFQKLKDQCLKKENSAFQAYLNLSHKFERTIESRLNLKHIKESMSNALFVYFESKLKAENYTAFNQTIVQWH